LGLRSIFITSALKLMTSFIRILTIALLLGAVGGCCCPKRSAPRPDRVYTPHGK
jgi:hypothetical protein